MRSRFSRARASAAVVGASATALMLTALPASAEPAKGEVVGDVDGYSVNFQERDGLSTSLIELDLSSGNSLRTYCVEIDVGLDPDRTMVEQDWNSYPNPDSPFNGHRDKLNWVLHHGYPATDLAALAKNAGDIDLSEKEAVTATQAAVWHFSDNAELDRENLMPEHKSHKSDVLAVYDYLTGDENTGISEPDPALTVKPKQAKGVAGERVGPFTISTNGKVTDIKETLPDGVTVTDAEGNKATKEQVLGGEKFYLNIPADAGKGSAKFTLTAQTEVATGRLFVAENYAEKAAQSLIVASSDKTELTATGKVSWTAAPTETTTPAPTTSEETTAPPSSTETTAPAETSTTTQANVAPKSDNDDLAYTGASVITPLLVGAGLLGVGVLALILVRRRKNV